MARALTQTGVAGVPAAPVVVSYGAVWPGDGKETPVDVSAAARATFDVVDRIKREHRANGWLKWDEWLLMVDGPDMAIQNVRYQDGDIDLDTVDGHLDRVGGDVDRVQLSSGRWGDITVGLPEIRFRNASVGSVSAAVRCAAEEAVQPAFDALQSLLNDHHGLTGFVHVDSIADPYTEIICQSHASSNDFERQVHGYYAALFLGPAHLEELGGRAQVISEAPCESVETVDDGVLCRLNGSPLELTADDVRAWREYLAPTLRRGFPESSDMVGTPMTPLARPVWLFEGPPVAPHLRKSLLDGYVSPESVRQPEPLLGPDSDHERVVVRVQLRAGHTPGLVELVGSTIRAWATAGLAGRLHQIDGRLDSVTQRPSVTDDLTVEFDVLPGDLTRHDIARSVAVAVATVPESVAAITIA